MAKHEAAGFSPAQERFLAAYRESAVVAAAARLAGVHRATAFRWRHQPAFAEAMQQAADVFFAAVRAKAIAAENERRRWRASREQARRPMRLENLRKAMEAKRGL